MNAPDSKARSNNGDRAGTRAAKKSERVKVKGWPGYVRAGIFVIEKRINTHKFHISTHCTSLRAALKQLERFESDPGGYDPRGTVNPEALVLTKELIEAFFDWHRAPKKPNGGGVTRAWALDVRSCLYDWANHLQGKDLRNLSLVTDLKPHLRHMETQPHHRVKAIRSLFGWLREEKGLITRAQDITLDLPVPVLQAAQATKSKAIDFETVVAVVPHLRHDVRDVLDLMCATGWHITDTQRFAKVGTIRERDESDPPHVLAVLGTRMKGIDGGKAHFTAIVHPEPLAAARRILDRGHVVDRGALRKQMIAAAEGLTAERRKKNPKAPVVKHLNLGAMRHSVSTWMTKAGHEADVWRFLGHTGPGMADKHYIDRQQAPTVLPRSALRVVR